MPPIAVLVALADPTRCRIVEILRDGAQPVHVLAASFSISRPAISRHLRVLKQARLISETKIGRENRYRLHAEKLKPVATWLADVQSTKPDKPSSKPASKPRPAKAAVVAPTLAVPVSPVKTEAVVTTKRQPAPAISQMGFDF